ncbi:hypothetical protein HLB44_20655 [Aquincola sp. S2]|uniref:Uncharacterized protein n=1 Tax=Pseudaquabacterium terrae TaxID=2732868 RepID=A0ABX2ELG7_9BURK|nr:hypothetical protein [Aquabacterium terrae]NRF69415.1 hypothetical protein [Aquabacterium terrae]
MQTGRHARSFREEFHVFENVLPAGSPPRCRRSKLGNHYTNAALVDLVYRNVTNTAPTALDVQLYGSMLDKGQFTGAELTWATADSAINAATIDLTGLSTTGLDYLPWQG